VEGIAFFLAGAFLVSTKVVENADIRTLRLTSITQWSGYALLVFGLIYTLTAIPRFQRVKSIIDKTTVYTYVIVFVITLLQVTQMAFGNASEAPLRWFSLVFLVVVILLMFFVPTGKKPDKLIYLSDLVLTFTGIATLFTGLEAKDWLSLIKSPIIEPLGFQFIGMVFAFLLSKYIRKRVNT
jgi:hypothetical protein